MGRVRISCKKHSSSLSSLQALNHFKLELTWSNELRRFTEMAYDSKSKDSKKQHLYQSIQSGVLEVTADGTKRLNLHEFMKSPQGRDKLKEIIGTKSIVR